MTDQLDLLDDWVSIDDHPAMEVARKARTDEERKAAIAQALEDYYARKRREAGFSD